MSLKGSFLPFDTQPFIGPDPRHAAKWVKNGDRLTLLSTGTIPWEGAERGTNVTCARRLLLGANTPWKRVLKTRWAHLRESDLQNVLAVELLKTSQLVGIV